MIKPVKFPNKVSNGLGFELGFICCFFFFVESSCLKLTKFLEGFGFGFWVTIFGVWASLMFVLYYIFLGFAFVFVEFTFRI